MAIITLTTDFGWTDYFVGAMKGVIYQIAPKATVVDITHEIQPQNILAGAIVLREIWRAFPPQTIHVAVIDPTVGTDRNIILAKYANQFFLVPDNGIITLIHQIYLPEEVYLVNNTSFFCQPISNTFHGRDIFAPVAAHLAKGIKPNQLGPRIDTIKLIDIPKPIITETGELIGQVIHIDNFGNLITNIAVDILNRFAKSAAEVTVYLQDKPIGAIVKTFNNVDTNQPLAYIGSAGFLEIAINKSRADKILGAKIGSTVKIKK